MNLDARFGAVVERLDELALRAPTGALSEPDPGGDERWEQAQVWAHIAEFVPYWHDQVESVIAGYHGTPVPFGRTKADAGRIEGIEIGRREPISVLHDRARHDIGSVRAYLSGLTPREWKAVGLHPRRGEMDVEEIVAEFLANHLEEHADQLDKLG